MGAAEKRQVHAVEPALLVEGFQEVKTAPSDWPLPSGAGMGDLVKARGSGIFHRNPDPNRIPPDPFLTTLWGGPD